MKKTWFLLSLATFARLPGSTANQNAHDHDHLIADETQTSYSVADNEAFSNHNKNEHHPASSSSSSSPSLPSSPDAGSSSSSMLIPFDRPSSIPSDRPSLCPSDMPSWIPSDLPSFLPSTSPSSSTLEDPSNAAGGGGGGAVATWEIPLLDTNIYTNANVVYDARIRTYEPSYPGNPVWIIFNYATFNRSDFDEYICTSAGCGANGWEMYHSGATEYSQTVVYGGPHNYFGGSWSGLLYQRGLEMSSSSLSGDSGGGWIFAMDATSGDEFAYLYHHAPTLDQIQLSFARHVLRPRPKNYACNSSLSMDLATNTVRLWADVDTKMPKNWKGEQICFGLNIPAIPLPYSITESHLLSILYRKDVLSIYQDHELVYQHVVEGEFFFRWNLLQTTQASEVALGRTLFVRDIQDDATFDAILSHLGIDYNHLGA